MNVVDPGDDTVGGVPNVVAVVCSEAMESESLLANVAGGVKVRRIAVPPLFPCWSSQCHSAFPLKTL